MKINFLKLIALAVIALASTGCRSEGNTGGIRQYAAICTMPMPGLSMVAITRANIDRSCLNIGPVATDDTRFEKIASFLKNAQPGDFDGNAVRARITMPDGSKIFISEFGELDRGGIKTKLRPQDLSRLIKLFEELEAEWEKRCGKKVGTPGCEAGGQAPGTP